MDMNFLAPNHNDEVMILYLNLFTLFFVILVSSAVIIASSSEKKLSYVLTAILLIPVFSQIRQVLFVSGLIVHVPYYVIIVYVLIRLLGPLINWHIHLLVERPIKFFGLLNSLTYLYIGYVLISILYIAAKQEKDLGQYTIQSFQQTNFISFFYPVLQLAHVGQASWLLFRGKVKRDGLVYFMRIMLVSTFLVLLSLQIGYIFLDRLEVELVLAPIIFCLIYSVIAVISIKYSALHNKSGLLTKTGPKSIDKLSDRENEVLQKLSEGKTDKEIAGEIYLSQHTVRTYCKRIYTKLELKNRTEAATFYQRCQ